MRRRSPLRSLRRTRAQCPEEVATDGLKTRRRNFLYSVKHDPLPPVRPDDLRHRRSREQRGKLFRVNGPAVEGVIQRAVPSPVLGVQRQTRQISDTAWRTRHSIHDLEQRVRAARQTRVDTNPEPIEFGTRLATR